MAEEGNFAWIVLRQMQASLAVPAGYSKKVPRGIPPGPSPLIVCNFPIQMLTMGPLLFFFTVNKVTGKLALHPPRGSAFGFGGGGSEPSEWQCGGGGVSCFEAEAAVVSQKLWTPRQQKQTRAPSFVKTGAAARRHF